jgi:hypothetical protein
VPSASECDVKPRVRAYIPMYLLCQPFHIEHIPTCRRADQSNIITSPILNGEHARRGHVRKSDCCLRPVAEGASTHRLRGNRLRALGDCGSFSVAGRRASTAIRGNRPGNATCNKDGFPESSSVVARQSCNEPAAGGEFVQELRILVFQSWLFGTKESPCGAEEASRRHLHTG